MLTIFALQALAGPDWIPKENLKLISTPFGPVERQLLVDFCRSDVAFLGSMKGHSVFFLEPYPGIHTAYIDVTLHVDVAHVGATEGSLEVVTTPANWIYFPDTSSGTQYLVGLRNLRPLPKNYLPGQRYVSIVLPIPDDAVLPSSGELKVMAQDACNAL